MSNTNDVSIFSFVGIEVLLAVAFCSNGYEVETVN